MKYVLSKRKFYFPNFKYSVKFKIARILYKKLNKDNNVCLDKNKNMFKYRVLKNLNHNQNNKKKMYY